MDKSPQEVNVREQCRCFLSNHIEKSKKRPKRYKVLCKKFNKYKENGRKLHIKNQIMQEGMKLAHEFQLSFIDTDKTDSTSKGNKKVSGIKAITKTRFYSILQHNKIK